MSLYKQSEHEMISCKTLVPVLVVRPYLRRYVRIGEYGYIATRFRGNSGALYILVIAETNVHGRIAHRLQQLRTRMLIEHPFTERAELLPFVAAVLRMTV